MVYLFPYLLCRLGGESLAVVQPRHTATLDQLLTTLDAQEADCQTQKEALSNALLAYIKQQEGIWQKQVHNFRRDLYNDRPVRPATEAALLAHLPLDLQQQIRTYRAASVTADQTRWQWQTTYQTALFTCRTDLQQLARHEVMRQGLTLSSPDLLVKLDAFSLVEPQAFRKRDNHTEQSLLKYLTRMVAKTSPFSTFTNLTIGKASHAVTLPYGFTGKADKTIEGHVRLNNILYKYIRDLVWAYQPLFAHVGLRPNPTLRQYQRQWVYLTNVNNIESFQRLPVQPVPKVILDLLAAKPTLTFRDLVGELGELVDASTESLETFLRQLIEYGFLETVWPSSGMDPNWDVALTSWLQMLASFDVPLADDLAGGLAALRRQAHRFATAPSATRLSLLEAAHTNFRALYWRIHEAAGLPAEERRTPDEMAAAYREAQKNAGSEKAQVDQSKARTTSGDMPTEPPEPETPSGRPVQPFRYRPMTTFLMQPKQLFYEDTIRPVEAEFNAEALQEWVEQLDHLCQQLKGGIWSSTEQGRMRDFFVRFYPGQRTVPLLTFYEDYYREVQLPAEEKRRKAQINPTDPKPTSPDQSPSPDPSAAEVTPTNDESLPISSDTHDSLDEQLVRFCLANLQQQAKPTHINISREDLNAILTLADFVHAKPEPIASRAAFVQFYTEQNQLVGVVNAPLMGWGRLFSRFLHILNPDVQKAQRTWNAQFANTIILTECVDASYFNANIHPPLMPYELQIPNGHSSLPANQQLPVADFHLQLGDDALQLIYQPTGLLAYCFDLGFQGPAGRSPLFRLVTQFSLPGYPSYYRLTYAVNQAATQLQATKGIRQFPRVVYNGQIVLQRRHWRIRVEDTPQREPLENEAAYALRLRRWCRQVGIPNEVFVVLNEDRDGYPLTSEQHRKLTRDDYKPQFIDFGHPLLILLFEKMLAKAPGGYRIEEMLPGSDHLALLDKMPIVSECLVQWYTHKPR